MSIYGRRLKELFEEAGLDDAGVAFRCEFSRSRIANYTTGVRKPGCKEVCVISDAIRIFLDIEPELYVLTGKRYPKQTPDTISSSVNPVAVFRDVISDYVDYGRIKLEPSLSVSDIVMSFSQQLTPKDDLEARQG